MCLKGQCDGYLSQDPCYSRRTVRSKVISYILVHSFGLEPKSPLSQSLHANHSGGELPPGRMDWSRTDFWLAVGTGKNRSSTTTSPCTPYPLPSELQGDRVGKDYLLQNLHLDMRSGISNGQPHSTLEKARFLAEKIQKIDYVNPYDKKPQSAILHEKEEPEVTGPSISSLRTAQMGVPLPKNRSKMSWLFFSPRLERTMNMSMWIMEIWTCVLRMIIILFHRKT